MKIGDKTLERTKRVLFLDKLTNPVVYKQTIKLELFGKLKDFMEIEPDDIYLNLVLLSDGKYKLCVEVVSKRLKNVGACSNIK